MTIYKREGKTENCSLKSTVYITFLKRKQAICIFLQEIFEINRNISVCLPDVYQLVDSLYWSGNAQGFPLGLYLICPPDELQFTVKFFRKWLRLLFHWCIIMT